MSYKRQVPPPLKRTIRVRFPSPIRTTWASADRIRSEQLAVSPKDRSSGLRARHLHAGHRQGSPCWAPMQLIPAIATVRFRRLLRLASCRRSPTRNKSRFESGTLHPLRGVSRGCGAFHPRKDESPSRLPHSDAELLTTPSRFTTRRAVVAGDLGWFDSIDCTLSRSIAETLHAKSMLVRLQHRPLYGRDAVGRHFPCQGKGRKPPVVSTLEREENFLAGSPRCLW